MRVVAIGILALLAAGCAPAQFDLVPRDPDAPWQAGGRQVGIESQQATVTASYDRAWLGRLIFDVEVVNRAESTLVVDPQQFSLALVSSDDHLPPVLGRRTPAESEEKIRARLTREATVRTGITDAAMGLAGLVVGTVVLAAVVEGGAELSTEDGASSPAVEPVGDPLERRRAEAKHERDHLPWILLHRTRLGPGESVRGELWFDARPLFRALGREPSDEPRSDWGITATPTHAPVQFALGLRAPAAAGAQEFEYFVSAP